MREHILRFGLGLSVLIVAAGAFYAIVATCGLVLIIPLAYFIGGLLRSDDVPVGPVRFPTDDE